MIKKLFLGFWVFVWNSLNFIRRLFLNLIVLVVLIAVVAGMWQGLQPQLSPNTVLTLAPYGVLVEQWEGDPVEVAVAEAFGESNPQTRLFDVLRAINAAASDENISGIVIRTNDFYGAGPAQLQDLSAALKTFRDSGKPVYAYGSRFSQAQYFLAAQAEQIYMDPMGEVLLEGFASYRNYYADATEKLKANVNVFRVGEYKSAVEPWIRNDMSPAAREANRAWLASLWSSWREHLAERRQIKPARLESYAQDFNQLLAASQGDAALAAQAVGLIDQLATPTDFAESMSEIFGQADGVDWPDYKKVDMYSYLAELDLADFQQEAVEPEPSIAVVVVQGALMEGAIGAGYADIGTIKEQLWQAANDDNVAGVVVRVDSPGGTITAAEALRRAIARVRSKDKPVYVSMGTVAASGGYWLATSAEQIWAQPDTLTGSIGIYGIVPTFERSLAELGVYTDGIGTSPFAGGFRVDRPLSDAVKESIQLYVNNGYQRFLTTVAESRNMDVAAVEKAASGRVWIGSAAHSLGLVDQLGSFDQTVAALAEKLELERYKVELYESELEFFDELLVGVSQNVSLPSAWLQSAALQGWLSALEQEPVLEQVLNRASDKHYQLKLADVGFAWSPLTLQ